MHARVFKSWYACQEKQGCRSSLSSPYINEDRVLRAILYKRKSLKIKKEKSGNAEITLSEFPLLSSKNHDNIIMSQYCL